MKIFSAFRMQRIRLTGAPAMGVSMAALFAVYYVQYRTVPARVELGIRSTAAYLALLGAPILLALSYRAWSRSGASEVPVWRRRVGFVSIIMAVLSWLIGVIAFVA